MSSKIKSALTSKSKPSRDFLKEVLTSLSLANLFFLRTWQELIFADLQERFYLKYPTAGDFYVLLLNILLLSLLLFLLFRVYRSSNPFLQKTAVFLLLFTLLIPINSLRLLFPDLTIANLAALVGEPVLIILAALFLALVFFLCLRYHGKFIRGLTVILLVLSPFVLLTFSQAAWALATTTTKKQAEYPAASSDRTGKVPQNQVLWLVFDELDQRMTFEERPDHIKTPEIDRLKEQALFATHALAPGEDTIISMPALITGLSVTETEPAGPGELLLTLEDEETVPWSQQPGIFTTLENQGYKTALTGCFLPYERIIGDNMTHCFWQPFGTTGIKRENRLFNKMSDQVMSSLSLSPFNNRHHALAVYRSLLQETLQIVAEPGYKLILAHQSIPHYPWIYDHQKDDFALVNYDLETGYYDNLVLVDRTLKQIREVMEAQGTWDSTHIIITSDHPWRMELFPAFDREFDPRIPFIFRLAGQQEPVTISEPFNTVITKELILKVISKELTEPAEVKEWIKKSSR